VEYISFDNDVVKIHQYNSLVDTLNRAVFSLLLAKNIKTEFGRFSQQRKIEWYRRKQPTGNRLLLIERPPYRAAFNWEKPHVKKNCIGKSAHDRLWRCRHGRGSGTGSNGAVERSR
jgi:hypothetical protein